MSAICAINVLPILRHLYCHYFAFAEVAAFVAFVDLPQVDFFGVAKLGFVDVAAEHIVLANLEEDPAAVT